MVTPFVAQNGHFPWILRKSMGEKPLAARHISAGFNTSSLGMTCGDDCGESEAESEDPAKMTD